MWPGSIRGALLWIWGSFCASHGILDGLDSLSRPCRIARISLLQLVWYLINLFYNYKEFICILVSSLPHSFVKSVKATNRLTIFECTSRTQVCKVRDRKYFPPSRMCEIFQTDLKALDLPWPPWPLKVKKKCPGYHPIRSPIVTAHS